MSICLVSSCSCKSFEFYICAMVHMYFTKQHGLIETKPLNILEKLLVSIFWVDCPYKNILFIAFVIMMIHNHLNERDWQCNGPTLEARYFYLRLRLLSKTSFLKDVRCQYTTIYKFIHASPSS